MQGGHRAVAALAHRIQQRQHLIAAGLPDDHPVRAHPQRPADQLGQADPAFAFHVGFAGLQRNDVGVQFGEAVQPQLQAVFDGDQPLPAGSVRGHRAQQGGFPGPSPAADDHRFAGVHQRPGEPAKRHVHGAEPDQVLAGHLQVAVPPDRQARPGAATCTETTAAAGEPAGAASIASTVADTSAAGGAAGVPAAAAGAVSMIWT